MIYRIWRIKNRITGRYLAAQREGGAIVYLQAHPELVAAETKRALITAALGGEYVETETGVDSAGRRHKRRRVRQVAPNLQAILQLLESDVAPKPENNLLEIIREGLEAESDDV